MKGAGRVQPLGALGLLAFLAGLAMWAWSGEWRWALMGFFALLALGVTGATLDGREDSNR